MRILTAKLGDLLTIAGLNAATLRSDRKRGIAVAAFGAERPVSDEHCWLIDGVALLIRNELRRDNGMARRAAAMVVRRFFDKWVECVSRIEHRGEDVLFAVAEQTPTVWWCGAGLAAQLPDFIRSNPPRRLFVVNVENIMRDMRERAKRAGFDLSGGSFFFPPDHELYQQWLKESVERRSAAQAQFDPSQAQAQFDPSHMKPPRPLTAQQRRMIETCL
jgi:hypothetical protein